MSKTHVSGTNMKLITPLPIEQYQVTNYTSCDLTKNNLVWL